MTPSPKTMSPIVRRPWFYSLALRTARVIFLVSPTPVVPPENGGAAQAKQRVVVVVAGTTNTNSYSYLVVMFAIDAVGSARCACPAVARALRAPRRGVDASAPLPQLHQSSTTSSSLSLLTPPTASLFR